MGNPWPNFELALQKVSVLLLKWKVFETLIPIFQES